MQIFVSGVWSEAKAQPHAQMGRLLGQLIASNGFDLACGPGTGISRYVIEGFRSQPTSGKVRFYLPLRSEMEKVGEIVSAQADEVIQTEFDYPLRNVYQVKCSDALFILTGGDGALEEAIAALAEYHIPVAGVRNIGTTVVALELLLTVYPEWSQRLILGDDVRPLFSQLRQMLADAER